MKKILGTAVAVAALSFSATASADIIVDLFDVNQNTISDRTIDGSGQWSTVAGPTSSFIGGYRELYVERVGGGASQTDPLRNVTAGVDAGAYSFSSPDQFAGVGVMRWDGAGTAGVTNGNFASNALSYSLGANLMGLTEFLIDVATADLGFKFELALFKSAAEYTKVTLTSSAGTGLRHIPLAAFWFFPTGDYDDPFNPGVDTNVHVENVGFDFLDLTTVNAMQATINPGGGTLALDLSIRSASVVPEPASLALIGLGLLGVGAFRRRSKKQA